VDGALEHIRSRGAIAEHQSCTLACTACLTNGDGGSILAGIDGRGTLEALEVPPAHLIT
jgi:hypothetical protein